MTSGGKPNFEIAARLVTVFPEGYRVWRVDDDGGIWDHEPSWGEPVVEAFRVLNAEAEDLKAGRRAR